MTGELAGMLRERIELQRRGNARDPLGGAEGAWASMGFSWARIEHERGGPPVAGGAIEDAPRWRVTVRARDDVAAGDRLMWGGRVLRVRSVLRDPRWRDRLFLSAEEQR